MARNDRKAESEGKAKSRTIRVCKSEAVFAAGKAENVTFPYWSVLAKNA
jgi:hypothetical protein